MILNVRDDTASCLRMSHDLRLILQDVIPEVILSQECRTLMDPIRHGSGAKSRRIILNKSENKEINKRHIIVIGF